MQPSLPLVRYDCALMQHLHAEQVHKAVMRINGQPRSVVVKVRHPMVAERLSQDFRLLIPLAAATSQVSALAPSPLGSLNTRWQPRAPYGLEAAMRACSRLSLIQMAPFAGRTPMPVTAGCRRVAAPASGSLLAMI